MREVKAEKIKAAVKHAAAVFLSRLSNRTSLITVTSIMLSKKAERATVLITVYPREAEEKGLQFANRNAPKLRGYLGKHFSLHHLPFITFALDRGEKNRQMLEHLSQS